MVAFQFFEVPDSGQSAVNPPTYSSRWKAVGATSAGYVEAYAIGATPAIRSTIWGTLYRQDIRVRRSAFNQWTIEVPYGKRKNEVGDWTWNFDTTGGTVHITNAKEEVARYPEATAPDQKGAIGVSGDSVKGVDITIPVMKIGVQFKHPLGVMTIPRAKFLQSITGTVNNDYFLTFAPGEVLFLGARGSDGSVAEATVDYQFVVSTNKTGLSIGDIVGIEKKGWEYLWVRYKDDEATADGKTRPVKTPQFVYIDRVYEEIAMSTALGFGA